MIFRGKQLIFRQMTQVLTIIQLGNLILQQKAPAIDNFLDSDCQNLIDSLITTVQAAHGVGIAAPQVARSLRLFIVASHPNPRYPDAPIMSPTAMINPRILQVSEEMVKGWEGCLSVPNWRGFVPRHQWIEVAYYDRNGREIRQVFSDFVARIFQHEYDHLEGILFLDRLASPADLYS
ncbi:MAG: peptide deformylase, partial [Microcystis aeruginosa]